MLPARSCVFGVPEHSDVCFPLHPDFHSIFPLMAHFLYLWKPEQVAFTQENLKEGDPGLEHTAGDQLKRVSPGDHLWIVSVYEGNLWLAGHIHVDKVLNASDAAAYLGKNDPCLSGLLPIRTYRGFRLCEHGRNDSSSRVLSTNRIGTVHSLVTPLRRCSRTGGSARLCRVIRALATPSSTPLSLSEHAALTTRAAIKSRHCCAHFLNESQ